MSIINKMYRSMKVDGEQLKKNPNRVAGGIRGAGSNTLTVVDESGVERTVPTSDYIRALEAQIRTQNQVLTMLEKKVQRLSKD
jgi:hypothetical protein